MNAKQKKEYAKEFARSGGLAVYKKYGSSYMSKLGKIKGKKVAAPAELEAKIGK